MSNKNNRNKIEETLEGTKNPSSFGSEEAFGTSNSDGFLTANSNLHSSLDNKIREVPSSSSRESETIIQNEQGVDSSNLENISNKDTNQAIDYFHYDFSANQESEQSPFTDTTDSIGDVDVDFSNVMRPIDEDTPSPIPDEEDITITKVLQTKDSEDDEATNYNIESTSGDEYRRDKKIAKYSLWIFYLLLLIFIIFFIRYLIRMRNDFDVSKSEVTLAIQSTYQVEVIQNKAVQKNSDYSWKSMDSNIATVNQEGLVTAVNKGETTIIVKSKKTKKEKKIRITAVDIEVTDLHFKSSQITMKVNESASIHPIVNNDEEIIISLDWLSSDPEIVEVDDQGHLTAHKEGTATIMAQDPNSGILAEIIVEVVGKNEEKDPQDTNSNSNTNGTPNTVAVQSIALDTKDTTLQKGDKITIHATIKPDNATNKTVLWSSSNSKVVTVKNGTITAIGNGTATITATTQDGKKKATVKITVKEKTIPVTSLSLDKKELSLTVGQTYTLAATIKPNNASNKNITWTSNNTSVATVENGKVVAVNAGSATITATTQDGKLKATVTVKVQKKTVSVTSVKLSSDTLSLTVGESKSITATVLPDNASNKGVSWSSTNTAVASVNNGKITALSAGTTTITVTTQDGQFKANCTVTVKEKEITSLYESMKKKSKGTGVDFTKQSTTSDSGVYQLKGSDIYYYRGNVSDNYVLFAGYCWQIVRTTDTQGIKLIYVSGNNKCTFNKNSVLLSGGTPNKVKYTNSRSVYLYKSSNVKTTVENWYNNNIAKSASASKVEIAQWCNDIIASGKTRTPTLTCANKGNIVSSRVGIITLDEMIVAGGTYNTNGIHRSNYYLYVPQNYSLGNGKFSDNSNKLDNITMISMTIDAASSNSTVYYLGSNGQIDSYVVDATYSIRPMIVLQKGTQFSSGNGTIQNPYVVK